MSTWQPARTAESTELNFNQLPESLETQHVKTNDSGQLYREQQGAPGTSELSRGWQPGVEVLPGQVCSDLRIPSGQDLEAAPRVHLVLALSHSTPWSQAHLPTGEKHHPRHPPQHAATWACLKTISGHWYGTRFGPKGWTLGPVCQHPGRAMGLPMPPARKPWDTPLLQAQKACVSNDRRETEPSFITTYCFSLMF